MSGRSSLICLLLLAATAAHGQNLPDINRAEVENVRLVLVDDQGRRGGVLEGALARKRPDGRIQVEDARVTLRRRDGSFVLTAPEFNYKPADSSFESPRGVNVDLPDEGNLALPAGTGTLSFADGGVDLTMECEGDGTLETGDEMMRASIKDPTLHVTLSPADESGAPDLKSMSVTTRRGGSMQLKLARLPALEGATDEPAEVTLSCFGDTELRLENGGSKASLSMLRRVRMTVDGPEGEFGGRFDLTCGYMEIRGDVETVRQKAQDGTEREISSLANIALDASQNVLLAGEAMRASGAVLRYRELEYLTDLRMEGYTSLATLDLERGVDEQGVPVLIALRSRHYISVLAPTPDNDSPPRRASIEMSGGASVQRQRNGTADWQVSGRQVRLFTWSEADGKYNYSFDAVAETFEPMLRVFTPLRPGTEGSFEVSRASVYGVRAEGTMVGPDSFVRVHGPGTTAVVYSDFPLADAVRVALGLRRIQSEPAQPGRLVMRAERQLELGLRLDGRAGDLRIAADESVELDHQPEQRDESSRLTFTGDHVALELRGGVLRSADLRGVGDSDALATLGYDLLRARSLAVREGPDALITEIAGPGRIVARDATSVAYLARAFSRLPRRTSPGNELPPPDAGWLTFSGHCRVETSDVRRTMELSGPTARLIHGGFEVPRAGPAAFRDLAELEGPDVRELYFTTGRRAVLESRRSGGESDPGVNLLRLEGDALVTSSMDGLHASAAEAIEISGAEEQQAAQNPFTAVLLGNSLLRIDDAGRFFGDYVSDGGLAYDGRWVLHAGNRLEITLRPLDTLFGGRGEALRDVRRMIDNAQARDASLAMRITAADAAKRGLRAILGEPGAEQLPAELAQPARALQELEQASRLSAEAFRLQIWNDPRGEQLAAQAAGAVRRAERLLGVLVDLSGMGGLTGELTARDGAPPLHFAVRDILVTFNGLGEIVGADADGHLEFRREDYAIRGTGLSRRDDGTLELDGAELQLPASTGIRMEGVRTVQLIEREVYNGSRPPRSTTVTRVGGPGIRVTIRIGQPSEE